MRRLRPLILALALLHLYAAGCVFNTKGNRRGGRPMVTRAMELRKHAGRPVTLVGTAREAADGTARLDLRGASVELPDYQWPAGFDGQPVMAGGTLLADAPQRGGERVYRLGEVGPVERWSR